MKKIENQSRLFPQAITPTLVAVFIALIFAIPDVLAQENEKDSDKQPPIILIHAGEVLAVPGQRPLSEQTIVVENDKIVRLEPGYQDAAAFPGRDVRVVNLKDDFVLPGLMDLHQHIGGNALQGGQIDEDELPLHTARHMRMLLTWGFTTVRDAGGQVGFAVRPAIEKGVIPGPRLYLAGSIIARTGGHGSGCDSVETCRVSVREQIRQGADVIKISASGGVRQETGVKDAPTQFFPDELQAIFDTADQALRPVMAHAHSTNAINDALRAGVRTIEHGTYFDDESVRLFKKNDAIFVPTSAVSQFGVGIISRNRDRYSDEDWERILEISALMHDTPGRAYKAGVKLGTGTDLGIGPKSPLLELKVFVENGIPENEAIKAATINSAEAIGIADKAGRIAPGYWADIIAAPGNPLEDINDLEDIVFTMKGGVVYRSRLDDLVALGDLHWAGKDNLWVSE